MFKDQFLVTLLGQFLESLVDEYLVTVVGQFWVTFMD